MASHGERSANGALDVYNPGPVLSFANPRLTASETQVPLVILMYHCIRPRESRKYVISPTLLEKDLIYLRDNGFTTVTVADLIRFQTDGTPLPKKPVMLTFDDGSRTNYLYAYPLLQKYGMRAVMAVVGTYIEKSYKSDGSLDSSCKTSLTFEQIREMSESGSVEIQSHSYDCHKSGARNGMKSKSGESMEDYARFLKNDLFKLESILREKSGVSCTAVAYPFGAVNRDTVEIVKALGYKASFTCTEGVNYIDRNTDLFWLKRYNRSPSRDLGRILKRAYT